MNVGNKKRGYCVPLGDTLIPDFRSDSCIELVIFGGIPNRNGIRLMHFVVIFFLNFGVDVVS